MDFYTAVVLITSFSMVMACISVWENGFLGRKKKIMFCLVFGLLAVLNIAEWTFAHFGSYSVSLIPLRVAAKFIELTLTPTVSILVVLALGKPKTILWAFIPSILNLVLQVVSLFTGCVFSIGPDGSYTHGPFFYFYVALYSLGVLYLFVYIYLFSRRFQHHGFVYLIGSVSMVVFAITLQTLQPELRLDWACISIGMILFYVYYDSLVNQVDALTGLLNRRSFDVRKASLHEPAVIIFLDVDYFKEVNDDFGHRFGDICLSVITDQVKKVYGRYGECYRFGGDEFCVLMTKNLNRVEELNNLFVSQLNQAQLTEGRLPRVSFGCALFDPSKENIDEALDRADSLMYQRKREKRAVRVVEEPKREAAVAPEKR